MKISNFSSFFQILPLTKTKTNYLEKQKQQSNPGVAHREMLHHQDTRGASGREPVSSEQGYSSQEVEDKAP